MHFLSDLQQQQINDSSVTYLTQIFGEAEAQETEKDVSEGWWFDPSESVNVRTSNWVEKCFISASPFKLSF